MADERESHAERGADRESSAGRVHVVELSPTEGPKHPAFERHCRVKGLAAQWGVSVGFVRDIIKDEPGIIRDGSRKRTGRKYVTASIPESVAIRVHENLTRYRKL